jgi:hypothetical protein
MTARGSIDEEKRALVFPKLSLSPGKNRRKAPITQSGWVAVDNNLEKVLQNKSLNEAFRDFLQRNFSEVIIWDSAHVSEC